MAKSLVQEVAGNANTLSQSVYAGRAVACQPDAVPEVDPNWAGSRLKQVIENRNRLKAETNFEGLQLSLNEQHIASHFDSMRSVSPNARRVMFNSRQIEIRRENELRWLDREIEHLKKLMGPLSVLVLS